MMRTLKMGSMDWRNGEDSLRVSLPSIYDEDHTCVISLSSCDYERPVETCLNVGELDELIVFLQAVRDGVR